MGLGIIILILCYMGWGFKNARKQQEQGNGTLGVLISIGTMASAVLLFLIALPVMMYYSDTPN